MNTANKLTMLRVVLIPVYLILWHIDAAWSIYAALAVFVAASLTDLLDGYIARHYNQVTDFGKFMDPLADKVLVLTAMACFCSVGRFPDWALVIVIAREFAVSGLRLVAVDNGRVIAAGWSGKVKTASYCPILQPLMCPINRAVLCAPSSFFISVNSVSTLRWTA